jgi:hypothetical protein
MTTSKYLIHGIRLGSSVPFPEFVRSDSGQVDVELFVKPQQLDGLGRVSPKQCLISGVYERLQGGTEFFAMYGFDSHYLLRWKHLADFKVARDGSWITCCPWQGASWVDIRPFFLGRVLPLALNLQGVITLHSSAVLLPQGAVAFVAESGTGKSTLASLFGSMGHTLITDDVLAVTEDSCGFSAAFGSPQVRLTEESLDFLVPKLGHSIDLERDYDKKRLMVGDRKSVDNSTHFPLRTVYLIGRKRDEDAQGIQIDLLTPKVALPILMKYVTNIVLFEPDHFARQFSSIARLVQRVAVKRIEYPTGLELLPSVCDAVTNDHKTLAGIA